MAERQVSLDGVPEPIARAIEVMVQSARKLAAPSTAKNGKRRELPVWSLGIKQAVLRRQDYYDAVE